ncbi:DUF6344 domain-containing protein [Streptomyces sp. NPDC059851]|uniref:DUF6344 domain-containing protein n=1 Tax=Streptomyces sp. NPDC059851 TaxID=3346971 RepID=UPI00364942C6
MAQRITFTSVWTVVVTALAALFAVLGLRAKAAAPAVSVGEAPSWCRPVEVCRPAAWGRRAVVRSGALPPTIKQRIRAEAHGSTPSVRRSAAGVTAGSGEGVRAGSAARGAAAEADAVAAGEARTRLALAA